MAVSVNVVVGLFDFARETMLSFAASFCVRALPCSCKFKYVREGER